MASDLFEKLAQPEVPPTPPHFEQRLHEQLNRSLLAGQLVELAVRAMPYAMLHLAKAVGALLALSLTGSFPPHRDER